MTSLWVSALTTIVRMLVGSELWTLIAKAVGDQETRPVTGEEKRQAVVAMVRKLGVQGATWAINLALEAAVTRLKLRG